MDEYKNDLTCSYKDKTQREVYYMSIWQNNDYQFSSMIYDLVSHGFLGHLMVPSMDSI